MSLKNLDNLILKNLFEASTMAGGAVEGVASPKEDEEQLSEEDEKVEGKFKMKDELTGEVRDYYDL